MKIRYLFETPIEHKDAKRRSLDPNLSKLLIFGDERDPEKTLVFFSNFIFQMRRDGSHILARPIVSFQSIRKFSNGINHPDIRIYFKDPKNLNNPIGYGIVFECLTSSGLLYLFKEVKAEGLVFNISVENKIENELEAALAQSIQNHQYERLFLTKIDDYGFFIFFSEDHFSLEILGKREPLTNGLLSCLDLEKRS
jgi:hypothetical protein